MLVAICLFVVVGIAAAVFWRANAKVCADFWRTSKKGLFMVLVTLLLNLLVGCGGNPTLSASAHEPKAGNPPLSAENICTNLYDHAVLRGAAVEVILEARKSRGFITVDDMKEQIVADETNATLIAVYRKLLTRESEVFAAERVNSAMLGLSGAALSAYMSAKYALSGSCPEEFAAINDLESRGKDE